jgi:hypothetical protein
MEGREFLPAGTSVRSGPYGGWIADLADQLRYWRCSPGSGRACDDRAEPGWSNEAKAVEEEFLEVRAVHASARARIELDIFGALQSSLHERVSHLETGSEVAVGPSRLLERKKAGQNVDVCGSKHERTVSCIDTQYNRGGEDIAGNRLWPKETFHRRSLCISKRYSRSRLRSRDAMRSTNRNR